MISPISAATRPPAHATLDHPALPALADSPTSKKKSADARRFFCLVGSIQDLASGATLVEPPTAVL